MTMTTAIQNVQKDVTDIKVTVNKMEVLIGKIEEHMKAMNGSIARHEREIGILRKRLWAAATGVIVTLVGVFLAIFKLK